VVVVTDDTDGFATVVVDRTAGTVEAIVAIEACPCAAMVVDVRRSITSAAGVVVVVVAGEAEPLTVIDAGL
jgi:hypothetical protein